MTTRVKVLKDFSASGKPLLVGLPGMGRVGYFSVNYLLKTLGGALVAELYSTYFPPHLMVKGNGLSDLFVGRLYDTSKALIFTADTQPQNPEGQNEVCDILLSFLTERGLDGHVIAAAAFVVPEVSKERKVFVAGNDDKIVEVFRKLGGTPLDDGVIVGINGAIVGWAKYYGLDAAVLLGETWSAIVEFDEADYRAAKAVIDILSKYLEVETDTSSLLSSAETVESNIAAALAHITRMARRREREERKEVL